MNYYYIEYEIKDYSRKILNKKRKMFVQSSHSLGYILNDSIQIIRFIKDYSNEGYMDRGDCCVFVKNIQEIKKEVFDFEYKQYQFSSETEAYLRRLKSDLYISLLIEKDNGYRFIFIR